MRGRLFVCGAIIAMLTPVGAFADDPRDAAMRDAAAKARDSEATRRLNRDAMEAVRRRGLNYTQARHMHHPRADGAYDAADAEYAAASRNHARDMDRYARSRAQYQRDMAEWRRAVAACRAGDYSACDR